MYIEIPLVLFLYLYLDSLLCQALKYQDRTRGLLWHSINIDAMEIPINVDSILKQRRTFTT